MKIGIKEASSALHAAHNACAELLADAGACPAAVAAARKALGEARNVYDAAYEEDFDAVRGDIRPPSILFCARPSREAAHHHAAAAR